ncbi:hypothetical protein pipiens_019176, partial [Culex pipiens pipiens]
VAKEEAIEGGFNRGGGGGGGGGTTIGTTEADYRTPVLASSTAKIVVDSRCQTNVVERDGTLEVDRRRFCLLACRDGTVEAER